MTQAEQQPGHGLEVELKFELSPRDVRRLCMAASFRAMQTAPPKRKTLRATYYDTPDLKLASRAVNLRVRKESRHYVQCVKGATHSVEAGGFARHEWEWPLPGPSLDVQPLKNDEQVKPLFKGVNPVKLEPIFSTDIRRQSRVLETPGGARVKCEIDQGRILSGEREAPVYELELELVSGPLSELLELATLVTDLVPARLSARSKAYRGFTLFRDQGYAWARAEELNLPKRPTAEDVLSASLVEGLRHLIGNEDCVLTRCHIEGVHQMRIAMRRMRAAITSYKKHLPKGSFEDLADGLKAAGGELGPARDWDVFAEELLPPVLAAFEEAPELAALAERAERRRIAGYKRAHQLIRSHDYARLLSAVVYWGGHRAWRGGEGLDGPATAIAAEVLGPRHRRVLKTGKGLKDLPTEKRHQLRIAIKKARYAAEFFAPLYPAKKSRGYLKALRALQDGLGHLNDLANAQRMMGELAASVRGAKAKDLARASGMVEGWYTHAQAMREDDLLQAWKRFTKTKSFW